MAWSAGQPRRGRGDRRVEFVPIECGMEGCRDGGMGCDLLNPDDRDGNDESNSSPSPRQESCSVCVEVRHLTMWVWWVTRTCREMHVDVGISC